MRPFRSAPAQGFTLIELLMTVTLLSILVSVALPMIELTMQRHREVELRSALREIREALNAYKKAADTGHVAKAADASGYPPSLDALYFGAVDVRDPKGRKIYFLRRIPRDPMFPDSSAPAAKSWGLRSYASGPDDPREGDDVFDVYSLSEKEGLNGLPYRQW